MGHHNKPKIIKESTKEKLRSIKKERKLKLKEKRARLVVRNLPFETTEENLKAHFESFGEVEEVQIVKRDDGSLIGCGFLQFKLVQKAAKARHHLDGKDFLGRALSVNFAKPKDVYEKVKIKEEPEDGDEVKIKDEPIDVDELIESAAEIKDEEIKDVKKDSDDEDEEEDSHLDNSDDDSSDEEVEKEKKPEVEEDKKKYYSHDVNEGKTVFVKNIPFAATNEDFKECMRQFGPVYYALVCIDKLTEHSKGSGFVKFVNVEDAEKALSAGTELTLLGNILDCHKALEKDDINKQASQKKEEKTMPKDSRNLYLVKEGVVLAGNKSAIGVSASDMAKRLRIEQYKTQMLRNLNMFVSRDRIVIHNLPPSWDDRKLRILFEKYSPNGAVIREAKVMRDLKDIDPSGQARSKEFGFVGFTRHEDALAALRALNNNPDIFTSKKRPIITFSIENKSMIKQKQKRLERSMKKNPINKKFDPQFKKADDEKWRRREGKTNNQAYEGNDRNFLGVTANRGPQKMRSRYNLQSQALLHSQNLKKEKKKEKRNKQKLMGSIKQEKQKPVEKKEGDQFSKMVADYKKKLTAIPDLKKSKWYEGA